MKRFAFLVTALLSLPALGQVSSTDEAYQRLQQRVAERQAAAATQPALDRIAALQTENSQLRQIIAELQLQIDTLKHGTSAPTTEPVAAGYTPASPPSVTPAATARGLSPTTQPPTAVPTGVRGETPSGQTATGIPTYTGPRGGTYHYSKSGNKVYDKHR